MKIFGFSIVTLAIIFAAFIAGTKMPNALSSIPLLNKI